MSLNRLHREPPAFERNRATQCGLQFAGRKSEPNERAQKHVSGDSRAAVDIGVHFDMREETTPAPNPLSIFTTTTLAAQELSMVRKGVMPFRCAPYPTDVGTPITGQDAR